MLAKEIKIPFDNEDWIFEVKWDGFRAIADINSNQTLLYSRNLNSFNAAYPDLLNALKKINKNLTIDGEIVIVDQDGKPNFQKLQNYKNNQDDMIQFYVFDILMYKNKNLMKLPLLERKKILDDNITDNDYIIKNHFIKRDGIKFFNLVKQMNLEGIIAKKSDSLYFPGKRTSSWLKIKNLNSIDLYIAGFTAPAGSRKYFGSLVLASKIDNHFKYAGNVGTGFNDDTLKNIYLILKPLINKINPFNKKISTKTPVTWLNPQILCEVTYSQITLDGILRHPVFKTLKS